METQQPVAVTVAPLGGVQESLAWISSLGARGVQWSATQPGCRPRDLDSSARRDLKATLRRLELQCSGIDLWIAPDHLMSGAHVERALQAVRQACRLADELGRVPVSMVLPAVSADPAREALRRGSIAAVAHAAQLHGVLVADASAGTRAPCSDAPWPPVGACIDPAAILAAGEKPLQVLSREAERIVGVRVVDLLRRGARGPLGHPEGQLDATEWRVWIQSSGFMGMPVIDARDWLHPREGVQRTLNAWCAAVPPGA